MDRLDSHPELNKWDIVGAQRFSKRPKKRRQMIKRAAVLEYVASVGGIARKALAWRRRRGCPRPLVHVPLAYSQSIFNCFLTCQHVSTIFLFSDKRNGKNVD